MKIFKIYSEDRVIPFSTIRCGGFFLHKGEYRVYKTKRVKIYTVYCSSCIKHSNPNIRSAMKSGKFKVNASTVSTVKVGNSMVPCACSPRIERISKNLGIDLFIGSTFKTSKGSVITLGEKHDKIYREYHCSVCSNDTELFSKPLKNVMNLLQEGKINCGCSETTKWEEPQNIVRCKRKCKEYDYTFLGWKGSYTGKNTKCKIKCPEHGYYDSCSIDNLMRGRKCPSCANLSRCQYKGNRNGYFESRRYENDTLYLIDLGHSLKLGRTFNFYDRTRSLVLSNGSGIKVLATYEGSHEDVYHLEQDILNKARKDGCRLDLGWTKEALTYNSKDYILDLLKKGTDDFRIKPYKYTSKLHFKVKGEV